MSNCGIYSDAKADIMSTKRRMDHLNAEVTRLSRELYRATLRRDEFAPQWRHQLKRYDVAIVAHPRGCDCS